MRSWSDEALRDAVAASTNLTDVLRALGLRPAGGNHRSVAAHIARLGLDVGHFTTERRVRGLRAFHVLRRRAAEDVFRANSPVSRTALRAHARSRLRPYTCAGCGNPGVHRGEPLVLQLDHVNGVPDDNRVENLRWLCPNCHSQTTTFAGRRSAWRAAPPAPAPES